MVWPRPLAALAKLFRPSPAATTTITTGAADGTPDSLQVIEEWPIYPWSGWTVEQVQVALTSMERGQLRWGEALLMAMEKNPIFVHGERTRLNAALGVEWELQGGEQLPEVQRQELAEHLPNLWAGGSGPNALATTMRYRCALGVGPDNVTWTLSPSGRTWLPVLHAKEAGWLNYFPVEARYRFAARDGLHWVYPDGREWLLFTEAASMYPHLQGNLRCLAVPWHMVESIWRYWYFYSKVHGSPQRKIKVPGKQRESDDVKHLIEVAQRLMAGSVVTCPQYPDGMSFDFELVAAQYSTYETFPKMLDYVERWMTLVWLGATDNTGGGRDGSRARAQVHERVSLQYLAADCRLTSAPLQVLLRQWCRANRLPPVQAPLLVPRWQPPADKKQEADVRLVNGQALAQVMLAAAELERRGIAVDWRTLCEEHGIPLMPDGTPVIPVAQPQDDGESADRAPSTLWRPRKNRVVLARGAWDGRGWERLAA